jgi:uncharacterized protein YukE
MTTKWTAPGVRHLAKDLLTERDALRVENARLQTENERLREQNDGWIRSGQRYAEEAQATVARLEAEIEQLRTALNGAARTGLVAVHVAKGHTGLSETCRHIICGLQRRTMEDLVGGPIDWDD